MITRSTLLLALAFLAAATRVHAAPTVFLGDPEPGRISGTVEVGGEHRPVLPSAAGMIGPVAVVPGAVLRIGMAFARDGCPGGPPTDFRIEVATNRAPRTVFRRRLDPDVACGRWTDAAVALDPSAAGTASFRFVVRATRATDRGRALHALWGDPAIVAPPSDRPPPNVIVISFDTLGARHVGAYGYAYPTTPTLDGLAADGTLFTTAVSHYPSTAGSHMTLFTGLLPAAHGVRGFGDELPRSIPTLPETLRAAGYLTAAVTEDFILSRGMGFARGFHAYRENRTPAGATPGLARETLKRGLEWIASARREPFFLFLHTYQVHKPYRPPPGYVGLVRDGVTADGASDEVNYDAEIRFADRLLGRFVARLRRDGVLDRTLLVVTGDHGDEFGEHGGEGHAKTLYDEVMRVPLVVRGPGIPPGLRVGARVGLADVTPTVLELAGVTVPRDLDGRSLVPAFRGEALPPRAIVAEVRGQLANARAPVNLRAVWLGDRKVIHDVTASRWHAYDLTADPREEHDLGEGVPEVTAARPVLARYDALGLGPNERPAAETPTPENLEKLRALGYVE